MTMTEGMHAIVASGILSHDGADDECNISLEGKQSRSRRQGARGDNRGTSARAQAMEYFNPQAGGWYAIRSESDW